ncbi:Conserved_hypothetical protein [Hexamita inflata]|uniref:Uncharacterized protein n=1 Tax=Hexamita inflata TaxID=28002 RepID=A0ABP1IAT9_9EUKA
MQNLKSYNIQNLISVNKLPDNSFVGVCQTEQKLTVIFFGSDFKIKHEIDLSATLKDNDQGFLKSIFKSKQKPLVLKPVIMNDVMLMVITTSSQSQLYFFDVPEKSCISSLKIQTPVIQTINAQNDFMIATGQQILKVQTYGEPISIYKVEDKGISISKVQIIQRRMYILLSSQQLLLLNPDTMKFIMIKRFTQVIGFSANQSQVSDKLIMIEQIQQDYVLSILTVYNEQVQSEPQAVKFKLSAKICDILEVKIQKNLVCCIVQTDQQLIALNFTINTSDVMSEPSLSILECDIQSKILYTQIKTLNTQLFNSEIYESLTSIENMDPYFTNIAILTQATDRTIKNEVIQVQAEVISESEFGLIEFSRVEKQFIKHLNQNLTIDQIIQFLYNAFIDQGFVKSRDQIISQNSYENQQLIDKIYGCTQNKLHDVCLFACLRSNELFEVLMHLLNLIESKVTIQTQEIHTMGNVRSLSYICQQIIDFGVNLLTRAFNSFQDLQQQRIINENTVHNELAAQFNFTKQTMEAMEITVINAVKCLEFLAQTRPAFDDLKRRADLCAVKGTIFVGISRFFVDTFQKKWEMFEYQYPQNECSSGQNILYTRDFGFFQNELLEIKDQQMGHDQQFYELDSEVNTCAHILIDSACQNLNIIYQKLSIRQVFEHIVAQLQQIEQQQADLRLVQNQYETLFDILRITLAYSLFRAEEHPNSILEQLKKLSIHQEQADKIYFMSKLMFEIDFKPQQPSIMNIETVKQNLQGNDAMFQVLQLVGCNIDQSVMVKLSDFLTQNDLGLFEEEIRSSIRILPYSDLIVRLTHLAAMKQKFNIALALSQFCYQDYLEPEESIIYPAHPCNTQYENLVRILVYQSQVTGESKPLVQAVQYMKSYFKNFTLSCKLNQRMGILFSQMLLNQITFASLENQVENLSVSVSGYNSKPLYKKSSQIQLLMLHQQFTDIEKRLTISYCICNNTNLGFCLSFLFNTDLLLCQQFLQYLKTQRDTLSELTSQAITAVESRLNQLPKFLINEMETLDFESVLPEMFKNDSYGLIIPNQLAFSMSVIGEQQDLPIFVNKKPTELN